MSFTFTLCGNLSELNYDFYKPIYLEDDIQYEIGLVDFYTHSSIPNIDKSNNCFEWSRKGVRLFEVPPGSYELDKLEMYMENVIKNFDEDTVVRISTDEISSNSSIIRTNGVINFYEANSIGPVLGFGARRLEANDNHTSDKPMNIKKVNSLLIDCNIVIGAFLNGKPVHIIHHFFPTLKNYLSFEENESNMLKNASWFPKRNVLMCVFH